MKYALVEKGVVKQTQPNKEIGFVEVGNNVHSGMVDNGDETFSNPPKTAEQLQTEAKAHFKELYLRVVDAKLNELDYDSLERVEIWKDDADYGIESNKILNWYRAIIKYNYSLIETGIIPTDEDYLLSMPKYV